MDVCISIYCCILFIYTYIYIFIQYVSDGFLYPNLPETFQGVPISAKFKIPPGSLVATSGHPWLVVNIGG